jgi:hypothetical protein
MAWLKKSETYKDDDNDGGSASSNGLENASNFQA